MDPISYSYDQPDGNAEENAAAMRTSHRDQVSKHTEEQQHFLSTVFKHVTDSVIVTDLEGTITYWSEGASTVFGYTSAEMMGKTVAMLYPEMDMTALAHDLQLILEGKDYLGEWKGRRKDGTTVWVQIKTTLLRNREGNIIGFIGIGKDITESKKAKERLEQSERRFRTLIEHSSDAIVLSDHLGRIQYASSSSTRLLGYDTGELLIRNAFELLHPDNHESGMNHFTLLLRQPGLSMNLQMRVRHKDGTYRWIEGNGLNSLEDPVVGAIVINFRDITARKRLEVELLTAKEQLEAIFQNVDDGIIVQDASGKLIYANQAAAHLTGYRTAAEMLQSPPLFYWERLEITDEQGRPLSVAQLSGRRALQGEPSPEITICFANKETHHKRWVLLRSTAIAAHDQLPALVITVIHDITQFKALEQRKDELINATSAGPVRSSARIGSGTLHLQAAGRGDGRTHLGREFRTARRRKPLFLYPS